MYQSSCKDAVSLDKGRFSIRGVVRILFRSSIFNKVITKGGVEDKRLEAKDTKKSEAKAKDSLSENRTSRGQGQECSRPRPKTKDIATSVLQKKGLQKSFSGNLQFIGVARIFDWEGINHKSHAMTSSKIYLVALNQDFAKGEGLN